MSAFGVGMDVLTLKELGDELGISMERARQVRAKGMSIIGRNKNVRKWIEGLGK